MRLFEFEAKNILKKYHLPVPQGDVAHNNGVALEIARRLNGAVVLKSQILTSSRGKAGGILFADNVTETNTKAQNLLGSTIKGINVEQLLVEQKLEIARELYASGTIDRSSRKYAVLASNEGGIDIEEVARSTPEKILKYMVDPLAGFGLKEAAKMLKRLGTNGEDTKRLASIFVKMYQLAMDCDAELVEINPLAKTTSGELVAADARIIIDDNATFRHPEFQDKDVTRPEDTPLEAEARRQGFAYVELDGDIGIIGNGAGLVMATLDLVNLFGGKPANFLDIGGGASPDIVEKALKLVISKPGVKAVLINILGGITRCDLVAQGIISALSKLKAGKPIAVRMMGTNEEEGAQILREAGVGSYPNLEEAIKKALEP